MLDLPLQGAQCHDSIPGQELRSLMPYSEAKKKKKRAAKAIRNIRDKIPESREPSRRNLRMHSAWESFVIFGHKPVAEI